MHDISLPPRHRRLPHALIVAAIALFALTSAGSASRTADDLDLDGYTATQVGGNDCVDSLQSAFMTNASCNPTAPPVFLESKSDPDTDDDIADHAWVRDDSGLAHLYFQTEDQGSGDFLEHYISTDLTALTYVGPALAQTPSGWDSYGLWAPHVIRNPADGLYYLFYAGVTGPGGDPNAEQRIGVATSSDLTTWTKAPINNCSGTSGDGCVYECDETWTRWNNGGGYDAQCRDPFVIWDTVNSRWLLFATARLDNAVISGPWTQGITVASSTDLLHWTGLGYIKATKMSWASEGGVGAQLTGGISENPFVTEYNGDYYLFFTDYNDLEDPWWVTNPRTMVQYASSPSLDADAGGSLSWTYRGYTRDPGVNATEVQVLAGDTWLMTHSIAANPYSGYRETHLRDLRVKRISWNDDGSFITSNLTDLACRVPSAGINPSVVEQCGDGLDNDCANGPDDAVACGVCLDNDSDGYGTTGLLSCPHQQADCNDGNASINPGATEFCEDGIDNNCDGTIDEPSCTLVCLDGDSDGFGTAGLSACSDPRPDCNDNDEFVNPGMAELCSDGLDNNCGGGTDEPLCVGTCVDNDSDGYGTTGLLSCPHQQADCNDSAPQSFPGASERCDRQDNDCDGSVDEGNICRSRKVRWTICDADDGALGGSCFIYY